MNPLINNINPFYHATSANALFDQSRLPKDRQFLPLRPFQKAILAAATQYQYLDVNAPSQSGKTTAVEVLAATKLYEKPGIRILILSAREEQAQRLIADIRDCLIACHRLPEMRLLNRKGGDSSDRLELLKSKSSILAVPHSMKALTGNPADLVIFDEMAYWENEDPQDLYAQGIARTGNTGGQVITISTFNGGSFSDKSIKRGFQGNYFHHKWEQSFLDRANPNKKSAALRFTYHVSPNLVKNMPTIKEGMCQTPAGEALWKEHYLGIPRPIAGSALFGNEFDPKDHVVDDNQIKLSDDFPLALCFDPGWAYQTAVLAQVDLDRPSITILRTYMQQNVTLEEFVKATLNKARREFPGYDMEYLMDVAAKHHDKQTAQTDASIVEKYTGLPPIMNIQKRDKGVTILKSAMILRKGFQISSHKSNNILVQGFQAGLVCEEKNKVQQNTYRKDGYFEHPADCVRYTAYHYFSGLSPTHFGNQMNETGSFIAHSPYDV